MIMVTNILCSAICASWKEGRTLATSLEKIQINTVKETCKVRISFRGSRNNVSWWTVQFKPLPLGAFHGTCIPVDMSEYHGCPEGTWYRPQEEIFGRLQNKKGAATKLFNSHKSPTIFHKIPSKTRAPQLTPHHSAQVERSGMLTHPLNHTLHKVIPGLGNLSASFK